MPTEILFSSEAPAPSTGPLLWLGRRARLLDSATQALLPKELLPLWPAMVESLSPKDGGDATATWLPQAGGAPRRVVVAALPDGASRHNSPGRADAVADLVGKHSGGGDLTVVLLLDSAAHGFAAGCAAARVFPSYSRKGDKDGGRLRRVTVHLLAPDGPAADLERLGHAAAGIRLAGRLVDTPAAEMTTDAFVAEAERVAGEVGAEIEVLRGEALLSRGFGGLYHVGRAARSAPALVHLRCGPEADPVALVGKGIVFDTGGLALKGKTDMPGMKADMGGAAAVLGAFSAAARGAPRRRLHALLCLAENAIGPDALRPDDVITLYSGKTVEINNPDAEGRLVVSDGVAYAARTLGPSLIVDLATLTGAQLMATGKRHAAVVCNDEEWERRAVEAGRRSGDLVHPLPYCPELFRGEFKSKVADLKNSVKDRSNAQSSCAAQFIAESLGDYGGPWLHVDMAGPVVRDERGTGYGVALLLALLG